MSSTGKGRAKERRSATFVLVILFCVFSGAFFFLRSPYFHIKQFHVEGLDRVTREEVLARCGQDSLNIFAFDTEKAEMLIESYPWIATATVERRLPDTIIIKVTERVPVAFMPAGDDLWLIDAEGRILGKDDGTWEGLVAITGPASDPAPGRFLDEATFGVALKTLSTLGPIAREKLTEISVQAGEVTLILDDGCSVFIGKDESQVHRQAVTLESVLEDLSAEGKIALHIDLRFDKVAIKLQFVDGGIER